MSIEEEWEQLRGYGEEMGLTHGLSLKQLIDSDRSLRTAAMQSNEERRQQLAEAQRRAAEAARQDVLHGEFVSMERLCAMTMSEVCQLLGEHRCSNDM